MQRERFVRGTVFCSVDARDRVQIEWIASDSVDRVGWENNQAAAPDDARYLFGDPLERLGPRIDRLSRGKLRLQPNPHAGAVRDAR